MEGGALFYTYAFKFNLFSRVAELLVRLVVNNVFIDWFIFRKAFQ